MEAGKIYEAQLCVLAWKNQGHLEVTAASCYLFSGTRDLHTAVDHRDDSRQETKG